MNKITSWIGNKIRIGWLLLAAGVLVALVGTFMEWGYASQPYNYRTITALGILLIGIGFAYLVRYRGVLKDEQAARRLTAEERDERTLSIRNRAGFRAFCTSTGLVYIGLIWASFADRGELPALSGDTLWYFLAGATVFPFAVYIASIIMDERNT